MKTTITAIAAAAFLAVGTFASAPALAANGKPAQPEMHPLPAIALLPVMMMFSTKENKNFRPVKPYGKNTRTSM